MLQYISLKIFTISFFIGLVFVYFLGPPKKIVYIYPTPSNSQTNVIKDASDACFKYVMNNVACPTDTSLIHTPPIQSGSAVLE